MSKQEERVREMEERVRALTGRTATVTLDGVASEPSPITGRVGYTNSGAYFDLLDVAGRERSKVRIWFHLMATITPEGGS